MKENIVSIVAAMDSKNGIGKDNDLLFRIPEDFQRMQDLTAGHPLVMGRLTFASIGRKLGNGRTSIVVTRDPANLTEIPYAADFVVPTLEQGIEEGKKAAGGEEVVVFGGGQIFKEAIEKGLVDVLHLTVVDGDFGADTFFPDYSEFGKVLKEESGGSGEYNYKFLDLERQDPTI